MTIHNSNSQGATSVRVAGWITNSLYTEFGASVSLDNMPISNTRTIVLPEGIYDFLFYSGSGNIVDRKQTTVSSSSPNLDIADNPQHEMVVRNNSGRDFTEMRYGAYAPLYWVPLGGDIIRDENPLQTGKSYRFMLPYTPSWENIENGVLILKDTAGGYYFRDLTADRTSWLEEQNTFEFNDTDPPTTVTLNYGGSTKLCSIRVFRNEHPPKDKADLNRAYKLAVNIFALTNHEPLSSGDSLTFKLEPGAYYVEAWDCNGKNVGFWDNKIIDGLNATINVATPCIPPGTVNVGESGLQAFLESVDLQCEAPVDGFSSCSASSAVTASELVLDMCYEPPEDTPTGWELGVGALTIDPDGYVYNADLGVDSKVTGATVACEVYDEDYQAWSEWPAAFYEEQINPQTTASDGYYAFFVPPGLYRVTASAPGYAGHTSPDIQVVDEIVHYNIPLDPTGVIPPTGKLFLPMVVR